MSTYRAGVAGAGAVGVVPAGLAGAAGAGRGVVIAPEPVVTVGLLDAVWVSGLLGPKISKPRISRTATRPATHIFLLLRSYGERWYRGGLVPGSLGKVMRGSCCRGY